MALSEVQTLRIVKSPSEKALIKSLGVGWDCDDRKGGIRCTNRSATNIRASAKEIDGKRVWTFNTSTKKGEYSEYTPAPMVTMIGADSKRSKRFHGVIGLDGSAITINPKKDAPLCAYLVTEGGGKGLLEIYSRKGSC